MRITFQTHNQAGIGEARLPIDTPVPRVGETLSSPRHADTDGLYFLVTDVHYELVGQRLEAHVTCVATVQDEDDAGRKRLAHLKLDGWLKP